MFGTIVVLVIVGVIGLFGGLPALMYACDKAEAESSGVNLDILYSDLTQLSEDTVYCVLSVDRNFNSSQKGYSKSVSVLVAKEADHDERNLLTASRGSTTYEMISTLNEGDLFTIDLLNAEMHFR